MGNLFTRSEWLRVTLLSLVFTILFVVFYGAVPSAILGWSDTWGWVQNGELLGVAGLAPRIRDVIVVGYHGAITPLVFVMFSLWQRTHPVNADADEAKRDAGGYR